MSGFAFDAFISYRRSDGRKTAHWLREALDGHRLPQELRTTGTAKLRIYLDTVFERATEDFITRTSSPRWFSRAT